MRPESRDGEAPSDSVALSLLAVPGAPKTQYEEPAQKNRVAKGRDRREQKGKKGLD